MAKCRNDIVPEVKRLTRDRPNPALPGAQVSKEELDAYRAAAVDQDTDAMGRLLAGELDAFATQAEARGHAGLESTIYRLTDLFFDSDPNRIGQKTVTQDQLVESSARTIREILADSDMSTPGGEEALLNFVSHIARDMETMPATALAIQALTKGYYHNARRLATQIDGGVDDIFTLAQYLLRVNTHIGLEGARKGIKSSAGRLLRSHRQDIPEADLIEIVEEMFGDAQRLAGEVPVERPRDPKASSAVKAWTKAREKAGLEGDAGGITPGTTQTRGQREGAAPDVRTDRTGQRTEEVRPGQGRGPGGQGAAGTEGGQGTTGGRAVGGTPSDQPARSRPDANRRGGEGAGGGAGGAGRKPITLSEAEDLVSRAGGKDAVKRDATEYISFTDQQASEAAKHALGSRGARGKHMLMEFWINGILSGPITHSVNFISNTFVQLWRPLEDIAIGVGRGNTAQVQGAIAMYGQMIEAYKTAFRMNGRAGLMAIKEARGFQKEAARASTEEVSKDFGRQARQALDRGDVGPVIKAGILDEEQTVKGARQFDIPHERAITGVNAGFERGSFGAQVIDSIGTLVNVPTRMLSTMDELGKSVNYRMRLAKLAHDDALRTGATDIKAHMRAVQGDAPQYFQLQGETPERVAALKGMHEQAQQYAKVATFTDELGKGASKALQEARKESALLQFAIPFVRTPVNLIKFVGERTPILARISKRVRADLASDIPEVVAAAKGRQIIGTGLWLGALAVAHDGKITGGGPGNSDEKAVLRASGWQPYSIRSMAEDGTITYTAYNRLDPIGMFLGISADIVDTMGMVGDDEMDSLAVASLMAMVKNLGSKSYFQGATNMLDALNNPDRKMEQFVQRAAASFVPNFLAQGRRTGLFEPLSEADDSMREVRTMMDGIRNRLPGFSADLPPRRNLYGDPIVYPPGYGPDTISPFFQSVETKSPAALETGRLAQMGLFRFNMRQHFKHINRVELDPQQYDEYIVLNSKDLTRNGRNLEGAIEKLIASNKYKRAGDSPEGRPQLIRDVLSKYQQRAKREMLRRHPNLRAQVALEKAQRRAAARSGTIGDTLSRLSQ